MAQSEIAAAKLRQHFFYVRAERSARTKGHLWQEAVVETSAGRMRRLLSRDGVPLSAEEKRTEDQRIQYLVQHPESFRRENQGRKEDEGRTSSLMQMLPKVYVFEWGGEEGGCARVNFKPNPDYKETGYEDRVLHAMAGYLLIGAAPEYRMCKLDASLQYRVDFGYGLLGRVSPGSGFSMSRIQVSPGQWKTSHLVVHVDGNVLLLKSISRQEDSADSEFHYVPFDTSVAEAAKMVNARDALGDQLFASTLAQAKASVAAPAGAPIGTGDRGR